MRQEDAPNCSPVQVVRVCGLGSDTAPGTVSGSRADLVPKAPTYGVG